MWRIILMLGAVGGISAAIFTYSFNVLMTNHGCLENLLPAVVAVVTGMLTLIVVDMIRLQPADSHTLYTLVTQYLHIKRFHIFGKIRSCRFSKDIKRCRKTQSDILHSILSYNRNTEYGRKFNFAEIKSQEEFIKLHPLTTYDHFRSYIERMINGENNILTKDPPAFVAMTSGTTGKNKEYPITEYFKTIANETFDVSQQDFPPALSLKRSFQMRLFPPKRKTITGLDKAGISVYVLPPYPWNIVPDVITQIYKEVPSFYVQAVFLLAEKEIRYVECFSSNLTYSLFKLIEVNWKQLCDDIAQGTIWSELDLDEDVRLKLISSLRPNVSRAEELRKEFRKGMIGLAKRLWPSLDILCMARTGSFLHCAELLEASFFKGLQSSLFGHGSTESMMGVKRLKGGYQGETDIYTLYITHTFFEFIPIDQVQYDQPKTLLSHQLNAGQRYEIVVTTWTGLYRYRLGDVIEVVDAGNGDEAPTYKFKYRLGQILNVAFERTAESIFYKALSSAQKKWPGIDIEDYTTTESFVLEKISGNRTQNKNYIVFVELFGDKRIGSTHAKMLDETLCEEHERYKQHRMKGSVAQLEIVQVENGTFEGLKERVMGGKPNTAFKMPRVLRNESHIKYLLDQSITKYSYGTGHSHLNGTKLPSV